MNARKNGEVQVFLQQGEICCASAPTVITTILGSCVAVCLWDPVCRRGGMNHFVMPSGAQDVTNLRYGDAAIEALVRAMIENGSRPQDVVAKVFGGATVLAGSGDKSIGDKNVDVAHVRLGALGIPVVAERTGGIQGMLVRLATDSGDVWLRPLSRLVAV